MYTENLENLFRTNKSLVGPWGDWSKRLTDLYRHTTQQNIELLSDNLMMLSGQLKRWGGVERPEDVLRYSKEFINEDISAAIELTHKTMRMYMENMEQFAKYYSSIKDTAIKATEKTVDHTARKVKRHLKKAKSKKDKE